MNLHKKGEIYWFHDQSWCPKNSYYHIVSKYDRISIVYYFMELELVAVSTTSVIFQIYSYGSVEVRNSVLLIN